MPIQFLDSRVSDSLTGDTEDIMLTSEPMLLGDIGLQTVAAIGTPNQSDVRVQLVGTVGVTIRSGDPFVTVYVQRGGSEIFGSGVIIYTLQGDLPLEAGRTRLLNFTAGDFPSAAEVASGQIRYTMFAAANGGRNGRPSVRSSDRSSDKPSRRSQVVISGPVNFMGFAAAGNS